MAEDNKRKALYNQLTQDGYDLGDFDSFNNNLSDGEKRRSLYDAITEDGYDVGEWDAFNRKLDDGVFWEKQDFSDLMEQNKLLGAELNETKDRFQNRMKYLEGRRGLQVKPVKLGQNSRVVKVASEENGDMGKNGPAYITESGNRYDIREQADFEQNAVEMARHDEQNREDIMLADIDNRIASLKDDLGENGDSAKTVSDVMGIVTGGMMGLAKAGTRMVYDKVIAPLIGKKGEQDRSVMKMALDDLEQARTTLERNKELRKSSDFLGGVGLPMTKDFFNNWKNFSYGIWDTLHDGSLYDMGVGEAGKAAVYLKMKNKMDRGEELNDQEMRLALAGMARAEAEQMADLPEGYRAGKITAQMVPFMVQMAVNPASGFGRSLARKAVRNFGRNGLKAVTARVGGRIAGNVGEAAVLANTLQAGQTAANIVRRHVGEFELNGDGQVVTDGGKGIGQSIYEGEVSNIIENFTELGAGGALNKLAGKITKKAALSKLGERMGLSKLSEFVGKVGSTPFARRLNALKKKSNWNGLIEEPLEEEYGIALNSLLATGDNEWSDFLDSEQQKDIFAGTMWFGGFMSTLNMGVYPIAQRRMRKDLGRADARGFAAFGAEWSRRKDGFDVSDRQIVDALSEIRKDKDLNDEQKAALFDYAVCLTRYQGSNVADMLMRMEDGLSQEQKEVLGAYERGASEEGKDGMNDIQTGYDASRLRLHMLAGEETLKRIDEGEDFVAIHDNLSLSGNIEGAQAVLDYVNARSARMGMMDRVRDDMEDAVLRSDAMVDRRTDKKDGMVKPVVLSTGRRVYVVGGNVVMLPDGEAVDRGVSDDMLIVVDEETGRVESVPSEWVLRMEDSTDGEQMKREAAESIRRDMAQTAADEIDGKVAFGAGETYPVVDGEGNGHQITVVGGNVLGPDGVNVREDEVMVSVDGEKPVVMNKTDVQTMVDRAKGVMADFVAASKKDSPEWAEGNNERRNEVEPVPIIGEGENVEPDFLAVSPERGRDYIYNESGYPKEVADQFVDAKLKEAEAGLKKLSKEEPKFGDKEVGTSMSLYNRKHSEWQEKVNVARQQADYWQRVKDEQGKVVFGGHKNTLKEIGLKERSEEAGGMITSRMMTDDEAMALIAQIEERAEVAPEIKLTIENWDAQFGRMGLVNTPIGEVKMGENQFAKLMRQGRSGKLGMIKPTLENPDVIIEEASNAKENSAAERNSSCVFVKGFRKADGSRYYYFTSVTVSKDGREVVVSNQEKSRNRLMRLLTEGKVLWRTPKDATTASVEQQGLDYAQSLETEAATKGSGMTPQSTDMPSSEDKVSNVFENRQEKDTKELSLRERSGRLGDYLSFRDYLLRQIGGGNMRFVWKTNGSGTRGLGAHLGYVDSEAERRKRIGILGSEKNGGLLPETAAQMMRTGYAEELGGERDAEEVLDFDDMDALGELLDVLNTHATRSGMIEEAEDSRRIAMEDMQRRMADEYAENYGFKDYGEYEAYKEQFYENLPSEDDIQELYRIFAEASLEEDERRTKEEGSGMEPQADAGRAEAGTAEGIGVDETEEVATGSRNTSANGEAWSEQGEGTGSDGNESLGSGAGEEAGNTWQVKNRLSELTERYHALAAIHVIDVNNMTDEELKDFAEEITGEKVDVEDIPAFREEIRDSRIRASYSEVSKKIYIFSHAAEAENIEKIFFHENLHRALDDYYAGQPMTVAENTWSTGTTETLERLKEDIAEYYSETPQNIHEEYFVHLLTDCMIKGNVDRILTLLDNESRKVVDYLLEQIGYDKRTERIRRTGLSGFEEGYRHLHASEGIQDLGAERTQEGKEETREVLNNALEAAERATDPNPSEGQKRAGNYKKGHVRIDGYDISIENPKGSVRRGVDKHGKGWAVTMNNTYGYIRGTEGVDGDHIDVFLSDHLDDWDGTVYVVDQVNPDGSFDEHKVMYGFNSAEEAREAYLSNYSDGWQGLGIMTGVTREEFKKWVDSSHRKTKPFAEYKRVKAVEGEGVATQSQPTEQEIKRTAAHFPMETAEEAAAFDKRVPEMDDAELLAYMQEDGKGDVNKAHHMTVYDEYDYRHGNEQLEAYDAYLQSLHDSGTTQEQAESMLANLRKDTEAFATEERANLLGQEEALEDYINELENKALEEESTAAPQQTEAGETANEEPKQEQKTTEAEALASKEKAPVTRKRVGGKSKKAASEAKDDKINDVGEYLAGARKDMRHEIAMTLANITEADLIEKPFGKVYKKPDLKKAVESGALREKDSIFYETVFSLINQQKPKVTQSEMRSKRYIPDFKTKAERWASSTYKAIEALRLFMEADEGQRDALIDAAMKDRYPSRERELAEIEQRKQWNSGLEGHKYEWGDKTTPNPLWVTYEVMNRLGYNVGDKLDIPFGVVKANTSGTGYSLENAKGERAHIFGSNMDIDEAIDVIVYLTRLKRGDSDISHPTSLFSFPSTKSESGESGRYRVVWGSLRNPKFKEFDSKKDADAFAGSKNDAVVSPIMEEKRKFGYKVRFHHPLTGEKHIVDDAEFDTIDEAQAYFDGNFEKVNEATNTILEAERNKKGEKKTLTADNVVHVTMVPSAKDGWKYAVMIDKKYANNSGMPYIIREGFGTRNEAKAFADSIKDEVLKTVQKHKEDRKKIVYFDTGENSRIGEDYREGKDADAEDFMNNFGFRGVQFGNWTNQADRKMAVNQSYDAFMDMARLIGVPPRAMSLNGELGIAFGARGVGGFAAHYEPGEIVINLTKTQGAGSLAHEWWHALDNYLSRREGRPLDMVTDNRRIAIREELRQAFDDMLDLVKGSDYAKRSKAQGEYWGRTHEVTARLLAEWVDQELKKRGELNTFLSRGASVERGQHANYMRYEALERLAGREPMAFDEYKDTPESLEGIPYPSAKEVEQFGASMRKIFDTLEEREDEETGNVALLQKVDELAELTAGEAAVRDAVVDLMRDAGIEVSTDWEEGQRVLDAVNGEAALSKGQKRALETASISSEEEHQPTVVSNADNAKVVKNIESGLSALEKIANGAESVPNAMRRDDLSQYGGDNNITFLFGAVGNPDKNFKGGHGIAHIAGKHGADTLFEVLRVIANGKVDRYVEGNKTVVLTDGKYEVVLALTRFGNKETWLFNGWRKDEGTGADGEVSTHSDATQANPTFSREDLGAVLSDTKVQQFREDAKEFDGNRVQAKKVAPVFYSNAEKAVEGIKQNKATAEQWLAMIQKQGGLKAGEDKWLGLSDFLNERKGQIVTKQELLDFIRKNQIQIEEYRYSEASDAKNNERMHELQEEFQDLMSEVEEATGSMYTSDWADWAFQRMTDRYGDDFSMGFEWEKDRNGFPELVAQTDYDGTLSGAARYLLDIGDDPINSTRLDYTTEGLENKREIALTVPTVEPWNKNDEVHFGDAGGGRAVVWIRFGETTIDAPATGIDKSKYTAKPSKEGGFDVYRPNGSEWGRIGAESAEKAIEEAYRDDVLRNTTTQRVLVIDEIQSKRHQEGREKGYRGRASLSKATLDDLEIDRSGDLVAVRYKPENERFMFTHDKSDAEILKAINETIASGLMAEHLPRIPDAPFDKNWHELAMKRMLRYAAENGYDKVAWTKGMQQAERYDLGRTVKKISSGKWDKWNEDDIVTRYIVIDTTRGDTLNFEVDRNGIVTKVESEAERFGVKKGSQLSDIVGKDLSKELLSEEPKFLRDTDLRIGGDGMKGFYDQILPRFMDKYGKKWGVKTHDVELPEVEEAGRYMHAVDVTPEMKASVMEGQPMFHRVFHGSGADFDRFDHSHMGEGEGAQAYGWGSYVTEVEGIGRTYAESRRKETFGMAGAKRRLSNAEYEYTKALQIVNNGEREQERRKERIDRAAQELDRLEQERAALVEQEGEGSVKVRNWDFYNADEMNDMRKQMEAELRMMKNDASFLYHMRVQLPELKDDYERCLEEVRKLEMQKSPVTLYTVEIPDDTGRNYLSWNKELDTNTKERIRKALTKAVIKKLSDSAPSEIQYVRSRIKAELQYNVSNGNGAYRVCTNYLTPQETSELLQTLGYTGIKYPAEYTSGGRADNAQNYVIFDDNDLKITDKVKFFRTADGQVYGYKLNGKIYIDPLLATSETPVHEYHHLWAEALEKANPEAWEQLKKSLIPDSSTSDEGNEKRMLWDYVKGLYPELADDENALAHEVFAHFGGRRGADRLRRVQARMEAEAEKKDGVFGKARVIAMFDNLRRALKRYWQMSRDLFAGRNGNLKELSAEDFADMAMTDLLNKVAHRKEGRASEPGAIYKTKDGQQIVWRSLFDDMETRSEDEAAILSQHTGRELDKGEDFIPSKLHLRKLEEGETCHVERVYEESKMFDFTGKEKVESADDVAYIFKQLETASVENTFLVLVKDGRPMVLHLAMGSYTGAMAPFEHAVVAYVSLKPEKVYFVHNHPSGVLKASGQDWNLMQQIEKAFGPGILQPGIIIDTTSGKYGVFGADAYDRYNREVSSIRSVENEIPIKVYQFSKQVFAPGWNPETAFKIKGPQSVAEFVSSHRLGEHKKMSFLVLNNQNNVVANVFLPWTKLSDIRNSKDAGELLAGYIHQCGGVRGVLYGNYDYEQDDRVVLASVGGRMRQLNAPLMDAIHVEHSAYESAWAGVGEPVNQAVTSGDFDIDEVNRRFNEELATLTEENVDRVVLSLGRPSDVLLAAGVEDKPIRLYGNKLMAKTQKHGYSASDVRDLPRALQTPLAVFEGSQNGSFAILTEMRIEDKNVLVSLSVGKGGNDIEFNVISSIYGKHQQNVVGWINNGKLLYVDKKKVLNYLYSPAPIAATANNEGLISAAKVVENFENPIVAEENLHDEGSFANKRFNNELDAFKKKNHKGLLHLGRPMEVLRACGVDVDELTLSPSVLHRKLKEHGLTTDDLKGLATAVQSPILVYRHGLNHPNLVVVTSLDVNGGRLSVSLVLDKRGNVVEINNISSVHSKEALREIERLSEFSEKEFKDSLRWVDKEKVSDWLRLPYVDERTANNPKLVSIAKVVENFENPNVGGKKLQMHKAGAGSATHGTANPVEETARSMYEEAVKSVGKKTLLGALANLVIHIGNKDMRERFKHQFSESWLDYSRSIRALQEAIARSTGKKIASYEDVWTSLNAKSSIDSVELKEVMMRYIVPLSEYVGTMIKGKKLDGKNITTDDVEKYLNAVHGIERNEAMAAREAREKILRMTEPLRKRIGQGGLTEEERIQLEGKITAAEARYDEFYNKARERDYAGLTGIFGEVLGDKEGRWPVSVYERTARRFAADFESAIGKDGDGKPQTEKLWKMVNDLNGWSLRKSYLSGLISKKQYDDTMKMYEHYVPLRGWHNNYAGDIYQYISSDEPDALQGVLRRAYGRKSRAADILGTMAAMANTAIVQGNKNLVANKFLNLAKRDNGGLLMAAEVWYKKDPVTEEFEIDKGPDFKEDMTAEEMQRAIESYEQKMLELERKGKAIRGSEKFREHFHLKVKKWQERQHAVRVLRNGREHLVYVLGNPRAAQAFNGLLREDTKPGAAEDVLLAWMRFKAKLQTSLSPEFLVGNFQRDVLTSGTGRYIRYGRRDAGRFVGNLFGVLPLVPGKGANGGIFSLFRKYDNSQLDRGNETERLFEEFVMHGGMTGISYLTKSEDYQKQMEKTVKLMAVGLPSKGRRAWNAVWEGVEFANKGIENATRFAAYMTSRQDGKSIQESIFDAKEASVNFNMKGSGAWGNMLARKLFLYVNPAVQALRMMAEWYDASPERLMKASGTILAASIGTAALWSMAGAGGDGDDDDNKWRRLSDWNRYNYVNVPGPDGYFHWNIPQEMRPIWAMGQIAFDWSSGWITEERAMQSMLLQLNNLTPMSFFEAGTNVGDSWVKTLVKAMTPTIAEDFTNAYWWNEDFLGHKITGQNDYNKRYPEWRRAGRNTPEWAVGLSRGWSELSGGGRNRRGSWESEWQNPSALYYILTQQVGGMGTMVTKLSRMVEQWRNPDEDVELRNIPFVQKFYLTTEDEYSSNRLVNDKFWMIWNDFEEADHELTRNEKDEAVGIMSAEEVAAAVARRTDDGSYYAWKAIKNSGLDALYDKIDREDRNMVITVRRMVVDLIEKDEQPDYGAQYFNAGSEEERGMWIGVEARRLGVKDEYGRKVSDVMSEDARVAHEKYRTLRVWRDVEEDLLLASEQKKAKEIGNSQRAGQIKDARRIVNKAIRQLGHTPYVADGAQRSDDAVMEQVRSLRRSVMAQLGIGNAGTGRK